MKFHTQRSLCPRRARAFPTLATVLLYSLVGACGGQPRGVVDPTTPVVADVETVNRLSVGYTHTCAIDGGQPLCWGYYYEDEPFGIPSREPAWDRPSFGPTVIDGVRDAVEIRSGAAFSCARHASGAVSCWGAHPWTVEPARLEGVDDAQQITAGLYHACALRAGGRVSCWGGRESGSLVDLPAGGPVLEVDAGSEFTCARLSAGGVRCWPLGEGESVELLADAEDVVELKLAPTPPGPILACLRRSSGAVECLVWTRVGTIGALLEAGPATSVAVGGERGCAILRDGQLVCFEPMPRGGFPSGERDSDRELVADARDRLRGRLESAYAMPVEGALELALGPYHSCVLRRGGVVSCWGDNSSRQAGRAPVVRRAEAVAVPGVEGASHIFAPESGSMCAQMDRRLRCWGGTSGETQLPEGALPYQGGSFRLPDESTLFVRGGSDGIELQPLYLPGSATLVSIVDNLGVARMADGTIRTWFLSERVEDIEWRDLRPPAEVVSVEADLEAYLLRDGRVATSGGGPEGLDFVEGVDDALRIASGGVSLCVLRRGDRVTCFLNGAEALDMPSPSAVDLATNNLDPSTGDGIYLCVRTNEGAVLCAQGGRSPGSLEPVAGLSARAEQIVVGESFGCARLHDGEVLCWGDNSLGQLGVDPGDFFTEPVDVPGIRLE